MRMYQDNRSNSMSLMPDDCEHCRYLRCVSVDCLYRIWHAGVHLQLTPGATASRVQTSTCRRHVRLFSAVQVGRGYTSERQWLRYLCLDRSHSMFSDRLPLALKDNQDPSIHFRRLSLRYKAMPAVSSLVQSRTSRRI